MMNLRNWTWQHWLLVLLVAILLYCLVFGCRFNMEFLENPAAEAAEADEEDN